MSSPARSPSHRRTAVQTLSLIGCRPQFQDSYGLVTDQTAIFNSSLTRDVDLPVDATVDQLDEIPLSSVSGFKEMALPWYSDQILPFDITLAYCNEYGASACARIYGVEILNEGYGVSIDDSVSEMQATFVARGITPMMASGTTSLLM